MFDFKKILIFSSLVAIFIFALGGLSKIEKPLIAEAGSGHNLSNYLWSDNVGWVSLNCTNTNSCGVADYGVNVDTGGNFSGYAWNDNVGWISFNPAEVVGCPQSPCSPVLNMNTGAVTGWAKVLAANGNGWDGWIKLSGTASDGASYGVYFSGSTSSGYSWGSDVIGWLSWSGSNYSAVASVVLVNPLPTATMTSPAVNPLDTNTVTLVSFGGTANSQSGSIIAYEWRSENCSTGTVLNNTASFQQLMPLGTTVVYFRAEDSLNRWSVDCPSVTIIVAAPSSQDGVCGSEVSTGVKPTNDLCNIGTLLSPPGVTGTGPWTWVCEGLYSGNDSRVCVAPTSCGPNAAPGDALICQRSKGENPSTCKNDCPINYQEL